MSGAICHIRRETRCIAFSASLALTVMLLSTSVIHATKVTVAYPTHNVGHEVYFYAKEKGFFQRHGLDVEFRILPARLAIVALQTGEIDFMTSIGSAIRAAAIQGLPVRAVLVLHKYGLFDFVTRPEIKNISELKGKTLISGSLVGATGHALFKGLESLGIDRRDVTAIVIAADAMRYAALINNPTIAGSLLSPPFTQMAIAEGYRRIFSSSDLEHVASTGLAASVDKIAKNQDQVKSMIRSLLLASEAYSKDGGHAVQSIKSRFGVRNDEAARATYAVITKAFTTSGKAPVEDILKNLDPPQRQVSPSRVLDLRLLDEVLRTR